MKEIRIAESEDEVRSCYGVVAELRPHISLDDFGERVERQGRSSGYRMAYLFHNEVKAVGGFRIAEWLAGGKYLEIEDLVAKGSDRSMGYGGELFDWIVDHAKQNGCEHVKLVSHVKRFAAHRFYLKKRMMIEAHYFSITI